MQFISNQKTEFLWMIIKKENLGHPSFPGHFLWTLRITAMFRLTTLLILLLLCVQSPAEEGRLSGRVTFVKQDKIIINLGQKHGIEVGNIFQVFRSKQKSKYPGSKKSEDEILEVAILRVNYVLGYVSRAEIVEQKQSVIYGDTVELLSQVHTEPDQQEVLSSGTLPPAESDARTESDAQGEALPGRSKPQAPTKNIQNKDYSSENQSVQEGLAPTLRSVSTPGFKIGGALRYTYFYTDWDKLNRDRKGGFAFDQVRIAMDGSYKGIAFSLEPRFYTDAFGGMLLHHGWIAYDFTEATRLQIGIHQVPFGITPLASNSWFAQIPFYLGFEDDYDAGIKFSHQSGSWKWLLAFYKNADASATDFRRFSYDIVTTKEIDGLRVDQYNEEVNQFNVQIFKKVGNTEIGVSGQWGQLYNSSTRNNGAQWAFATHANVNHGNANLKVEYIRYAFNPDSPAGAGSPVVSMAAFNAAYLVATRGEMYLLGISYGIDVAWGPVSKLTFYDDYSYFDKESSSFADSQNQIFGVMVTAGKVYTLIDYALGKNHPWIGRQWTHALARGIDGVEWDARFNINIGYYF
ncbi:MAG: hypothetical protein O7G87_20415 [bacterium]|nr:hypothetical protein [bacterium]